MASIDLRTACIGLAALGAAGAQAQSDVPYPVKPVRVVVGFTPGSATDITARIFAQKFAESFGTTVAVDNIPGAAGTIGGARVAKAPPDGYTLYYGANGALTIAPTLLGKVGFDPNTDFAPVGLLLTMASILAVNPYLPVKSVQELIALARKRPGELSYASPGVGVPQHIAGELIKLTAKIDMTHVPYKGAVMTDVIGGRVPLTLQNVAAIIPTIREGRLRALAVTSLKRSSNIPDIPTLDESGFPGFEAISWFGLLAPAGTPAAITNRVHQEAMKILALPDTRARFAQLSLELSGSTGSELAGVIRRDIDKWAKVIKQAGITAGE